MTETGMFTPKQLASVDEGRIPRHVAIIPDGNRRWAKQHKKRFDKGHKAGANVLIQIVKAAKELGIQALTFYLFSTENWNRPREEVTALMWLLKNFLRQQCKEMEDHGVRLQSIGQIEGLPKGVRTALAETMQATAHCNQIDMIFALNYGARDEICRSFQQIIDKCLKGELKKEQVNESLIAGYLDTAPWGDPDLLIRTSGEMRVSNFLLWQLSYAEIYVTEVLWPDFTPEHLLKAVIEYQHRERRLGGS